jgi:protein-disulfide isomerase
LLAEPVSDGDHVNGPVDAKLTFLEYGDFECPDTRRAYGICKELRRHFNSRLRFVWRHFPMTWVHPHAQQAAEVAEAAAAQGHFWPMHDCLLERQFALDDKYLIEYASELGLDAPRAARELASHVHGPRVRRDALGATRSGVRHTPTFFVNGRRHHGKWDLEILTAVLEQTLRMES